MNLKDFRFMTTAESCTVVFDLYDRGGAKVGSQSLNLTKRQRRARRFRDIKRVEAAIVKDQMPKDELVFMAVGVEPSPRHSRVLSIGDFLGEFRP